MDSQLVQISKIEIAVLKKKEKKKNGALEEYVERICIFFFKTACDNKQVSTWMCLIAQLCQPIEQINASKVGLVINLIFKKKLIG